MSVTEIVEGDVAVGQPTIQLWALATAAVHSRRLGLVTLHSAVAVSATHDILSGVLRNKKGQWLSCGING